MQGGTILAGARIRYREFYDVPRAFLVRYKQRFFFFESLFSEQFDDYLQTYDVYLMPELTVEEIDGSWEQLGQKAICKVCEIPVIDVKFDSTHRKEIHTELLEKLISEIDSDE
jgi:hypothetical protein